MNILFFAAVVLAFAATCLQFAGVSLKRPSLCRFARMAFAAALAAHLGYTLWRGIAAGRLPLANQFEFASGFALACSLMAFVLHARMRRDWIMTAAMPATFLILSYAAFQPMEIRDLMPALRSTWFALHIGSAAFSYASFAIAGALGATYLVRCGRGEKEGDDALLQIDYMIYRMICLGFLLLTVVIFSGAIWAEQAWSSWWSWDPKETWALITWIFYAICLHQRLRAGWQGKRMALAALVALVLVIFTFAGVNLIMPGLHSYAT